MTIYAECVQTWSGMGPFPAVNVPLTVHQHAGLQSFELSASALSAEGGHVELELYDTASGVTLATAHGNLLPGVRTTLVTGMGAGSLPVGAAVLGLRAPLGRALPDAGDCYSVKFVELDEDPAQPRADGEVMAAKSGRRGKRRPAKPKAAARSRRAPRGRPAGRRRRGGA